ncbi:MAG: hypothetical protein RhofKO_43200 [Rhodothermales bacterium]
MRILCCFLIALMLVVWSDALYGQTTQVDGQISTQINAGAGTGGADQLQVTLQLQAQGEAFDLGTSTLMFTFNNAALAIPSGAAVSQALTSGTDYAFREPWASNALYNKSVTVFGSANRLSVNIELFVPNMGQPIAEAFTPVIDLFFNITDPSQTSQLTWITAGDPNPTVVVDEDNTTNIPLGAFIGDNQVLPVELASLTAVANGTVLHVAWETLSEINFAGFGVEVQYEKGLWEEKGFVSARGTGEFGASYRYTIRNVRAGRYAIRLREVDTDGTVDYSPTVEVQVDVTEVVQAKAYPNPFSGTAQVDVALASGQHLTATLYDLRGRRVRQLYAGQVAAHQTLTLTIDGQGLPSGVYLIRFTGDRFTESRRLVHQ